MAAETYKDVEGQNARERLEDFFRHQEEKQVQQSEAGFDKEMSAYGRGLTQRGMQRSSYGRQVIGNMARQKVLASNDIRQNLLGEYGNRLYQIERDETADRQWQMQFDENRRQFDEQMAWNRENAATQAAQWQSQFDAANRQWQSQFEEGVRQFDVKNQPTVSSGGGGGGSRSKTGGTTATENKTWRDWLAEHNRNKNVNIWEGLYKG